jgi:hypothetical protein
MGADGISSGSHSGSRLKIRSYVAEDGSRLDLGVFDSALETPCHFGVAADGVTRCLPTAPAYVGYLDPGCTKPMAVSFKACDGDAPKYAIQQLSDDACSEPYDYFRVGAPIAAPDAYFSAGPSTCQQNAVSSKAVFFDLGVKAQLEDFEAATIELQ